MPAVDPSPPRPTRRVVTSGLALLGLGVAGVGLAGCGIRLEDDAPDIPFVPTRRPLPAESALVALVHECADLAEAAATLDAAVPQALSEVHRRQEAVLLEALRGLGVPAAVLSPSPPAPSGASSTSPVASPTSPVASPTSPVASPTSPVASPTTSPSPQPVTAAQLARQERATLAQAGVLADAPASLAPALVALLAQRRAAADLLGAPAPVPPPPLPLGESPTSSPSGSTGPPPTATSSPGASSSSAASPGSASSGSATPAATEPELWPTPDPVVPLVAAGRRAAYLFEVVAARTTKATRTTAVATSAGIRSLVRAQETFVGDAAPPPDLGQALPFEVDDVAGVRRLARTAVTDLRTAYGAQLPALAATPQAALVHGAAWLGAVESMARRWGVALEPFPGLQ